MSFTTPEFARSGPTSPGRGRGSLIALVLAVIVLVVGVIATVVVVATGSDGGSDELKPPPQDMAVPTQITWQVVGRAELPFSEQAGPRELDGVAARGFAHSETGAVIAAWQIAMRLSVLSGTDDIYATQVIGSRETVDGFRLSVADLQASLEPDQQLPRVLAWKPARPYSKYAASFDYAVPTDENDTVNVIRFSVVWTDGDWKLQPGLYGDGPDDGLERDEISTAQGWHFFDGELQ